MTKPTAKPPRGGPLWLACAMFAFLALSACSSTLPLACPRLPPWPSHLDPIPMLPHSIPQSDSPKPSTGSGKTTESASSTWLV